MLADILYPDNPKRREQVRQKTAEARLAFITFNHDWNRYVDYFTQMVNQVVNQEEIPLPTGFKLDKVDLNPDKETIESMVNKINEVTEKAKSQIFQFNQGVSQTLDAKQAAEFGKLTDFDNVGKLEKGFEIGIPTTIGSGIAIYLGVQMVQGWIALAANGIALSAGVIAMGALGAGILSAFGLIVSDFIVSIFTGLSEKKKLEKALKDLRALDEQVVTPLNYMNAEIAGETSAIISGVYRVAENTLLIRRSDDTWVAMPLAASAEANHQKFLTLVA